MLDEIARACSPRVQAAPSGRAVVFDASGLDRAIGTPAEIGAAVQQLAANRGARVRVALARTRVAAWLLAHAREGVTVAAGDPRAALAPLPLGWLATLPRPASGQWPTANGQRNQSGQRPRANGQSKQPARNYRMAPGPADDSRSLADDVRQAADAAAQREVVAIFERWGIRTLGDLARLPRGDIHARTGPAGVRLHQAACGEDEMPLVPDVEAARFVERLQLDWPIEGLEPLSFVLGRMCDALSRSLERADRGAVTVTTRLVLVSRETHARTLHLPAPMRDARVLRTLILLDLESHPPPTGIDAVEIDLDVVAGRIVQGSLLARALPSPEDLATLVARLQALVGESHVGAPALVDSHDARAFAMRPFAPTAAAGPGPRAPDNAVGQRPTADGFNESGQGPTANDQRGESSPGPQASGPSNEGRRPQAMREGRGPVTAGHGPRDVEPKSGGRGPTSALRRLRRPIPARVRLERGLPVHVQPSSRAVSGGAVVARAGPWRTSGQWWTEAATWDRDEWEVELDDGGCYRLARLRSSGGWEVEGEID